MIDAARAVINLLLSDHTGATAAAAAFAAVAAVLVVSILALASNDAPELSTTVAHSRFATAADLQRGKIITAALASKGARASLTAFPFLGALRNPHDRKCPPYALQYRGDGHILVFGAPSTLKSTTGAACNLLLLRRSFIVFDPKGELYAITHQARRRMGSAVILVNAFGELTKRRNDMTSDGWNPLGQVDPASPEFYSRCKTIAEAVTDLKPTGNDFFETSALGMWTLFCMDEVLRNGRNAHLRNVRELLSADHDKLVAALAGMKDDSDSKYYALRTDAAAMHARLTSKSDAKSLLDVIATSLKNTDFLNEDRIATDMANGNGIDFAAMQHDLTTVYIVVPMSQLDKQAKYLRMCLNLCLESFFDNAPDPDSNPLPRVGIMIDEMGQMGRLPAVCRALTAIRGYNVQLWMFFQELQQIKKAYPHDWTQFFTGSGVKVTLRVRTGDSETAEHFAKMLGKREVDMTSFNVNAGTASANARGGSGATTATQVHDLMRPEEFHRLRRQEAIISVEDADGFPCSVQARSLGYWELFEPDEVGKNPYHHG